MLSKSIIVGLFSLSAITEASVVRGSPFDHILNRRIAKAIDIRATAAAAASKATATCLNANALQTASASDGGPAADAGQAASETYGISPTTTKLRITNLNIGILPTSSTCVQV
jgi:hypothetical protein